MRTGSGPCETMGQTRHTHPRKGIGMDLSIDQKLHGFTVRTREELPEIDGTAFVLDHGKSGAKLLYLQNDDTNKAFSISFKTPPADDTGVFHILEHSVLCGSDKFPVKEPFVNLLKSSMQTFLNAMTFPDKTMYPVASTNGQDLLNLMDVYLDAVLHPAIYHKRAIFEQEGWHYELAGDMEADEGDAVAGDAVAQTEAADGQTRLALNGVVYNEMKGALSDPNSVLYDELQAALFPDTAYRFESGGTPRAIPDLTYEQFLEEHRRHYRLDNSYLTLYGDVDIDVVLAFLDQEYLSPVADEQAAATGIGAEGAPLGPHELALQAPVCALGVAKNMATAPENACMGLGYVLGTARERTRMVAADILIDALMGSNEAPLKRALLDADLADDAQAFLADALLQPFAVIQLKGLEEGAAERFKGVVDDTLRRLADGRAGPRARGGVALARGIRHARARLRHGRRRGAFDGGAFGLALRRRPGHVLPQVRRGLRLLAPRARRGLLRTARSARRSWRTGTWPRWRCAPSQATRTPSRPNAWQPPRRAWARRTTSAWPTKRPPCAGLQDRARSARGAGHPAAPVRGRSGRGARRARVRLGRRHARALPAPPHPHARHRLRLPLLRPGAAVLRRAALCHGAGHRAGQAGHRRAHRRRGGHARAEQAGQPDASSWKCTRTPRTASTCAPSWWSAPRRFPRTWRIWPATCRTRSCSLPTCTTCRRSRTRSRRSASAWSRASRPPATAPPWPAWRPTTCPPPWRASSWAASTSTASSRTCWTTSTSAPKAWPPSLRTWRTASSRTTV